LRTDRFPLMSYTPIPEFGDAIVPALIVLGLFGWLSMRRRKEGR
jgi:hypothetical protein